MQKAIRVHVSIQTQTRRAKSISICNAKWRTNRINIGAFLIGLFSSAKGPMN